MGVVLFDLLGDAVGARAAEPRLVRWCLPGPVVGLQLGHRACVQRWLPPAGRAGGTVRFS
jgi:hypothetical protein